MANFPTNPSIGDLFETKHDTFKWNGSGWEALGRILTNRAPPTAAISSLSIKESGGVLDVGDTSTVLLIGEALTESPVKTAHSSDANTLFLNGETEETGVTEHANDGNTSLLIGQEPIPATNPNTTDVATSLLLNSNYDSSDYTHSVTANGNAKLVKGYSFDGNGDYISVPDSSDWDFGSNDFTVEMWVNFSTIQDSWFYNQAANDNNAFAFGYISNQLILKVANGSWGSPAIQIAENWSASTGTWYHVAVTRSGNDFKLWVDGTQLGSTVTDSDSCPSFSANAIIGIYGGNLSASPFHGYIDNVRISNGTARYTANFTTEVTTIDANHKLVLDGKATDSSDSSHSLTFSGNAHEVSKLGGDSWKFDGSGDYLTVPDSTDWDWSGEFTVEAWVKFNSLSGWRMIINSATANTSFFRLAWSGSQWSIAVLNSATYHDDTVSTDTWYHLALVRDSSNNLKLYRDGVLKGTNSSATSGTIGNTGGLTIGAYSHLSASQEYIDGYISNLRISTGIARYTSTFTPHTASHTKDVATKLLLQGGMDSSDLLLPTFNGNTKILSSGYRFYDEDWINTPSSSDFAFGTGDFTVEFWAYNEDVSNSTQKGLIQISDNAGGIKTSYDTGFVLNLGGGIGDGVLRLHDGTQTVATGTGIIKTYEWQHIAITRESNTAKIYINGKEEASGSFTRDIVGTNMAIGMYYGYNQGGYDYGMRGYMKDVRVSKGVARYTADFTALVTAKDSSHKLILNNNGGDDSDSNHTLTLNNDTHSVANRGTHSFVFDGTGDYLHIPADPSLSFTGDFTIEMWVYMTATETNMRQISSSNYYVGGKNGNWYFGLSPNNLTFYSFDGTGNPESVSVTPTANLNTWYHIAAVRSGNTVTLYLDGVSVGSGTVAKNLVDGADGGLDVGRLTIYGDHNGYINNLRISSTARYTSAFSLTDSIGIIDLSSNTHSVTANGDAELSTTQKKFGTHSLYFDGAGDYLEIPSHATLLPGTGAWTAECWVKTTRAARSRILSHYDGTGTNTGWYLDINSNQAMFFAGDGSSWFLDNGTTAINDGNWHHVALVFTGTNYHLFVDGTSEATGSYNININPVSGTSFRIGNAHNMDWNQHIDGYIDNVRLSNTARYTSNFYADPTTLITDQSSNSHAITASGNAALSTAQKKFGTYSLSFDGSGDYVEIPASSDFDFGTNEDFTIEMWVYFNSFGSHNMLANQWSQNSGHTGDWQMFFRNSNNGKLEFFYRNSGSWAASVTTATAVALNTWTHVAIVRSSGTIKFYFNGVADSTTVTDSEQIGDSGKALRIGRTLQPDHNLNGYVDDFRISDTARYTSDFVLADVTLPIDKKGTHALTLNGDTLIASSGSSENTKFGTGAISFDGTGDYISTSSITLDGDFTIEVWVKPTTTNSCKIMTIGDVKQANSFEIFRGGGSPSLRIDTGSGSGNSLLIQGSADVTVNEWQHIAAVRSGSTLTFYKDGVSIGSTTTSATFTGDLRIGAEWFNGGLSGTMTGYMDEFRISTSARYTADFTPQSVEHDLVDVNGWGSPVLGSTSRSLFVNKNGLVMKSSDGTLTKMNAGANAQTTGIRKLNALSDAPVPSSYHLNNSLFNETTIHTGDGMNWVSPISQPRTVLTTPYIWQVASYVDYSGAVPLMKFVMIGHAGHTADDFEEIDTGVQIGDAGDLAAGTVGGIEMRNGNLVDSRHWIKWKHKHDAKSDTYYSVSTLIKSESNVISVYLASITGNQYFNYPTDEYVEQDDPWLTWRATWNPDTGDWTIQDDDTRWVETTSTDVINLEGDGGLLRKFNRQYQMQEDAADGRMWEVGVRAKPALFAHNGPDENTKLLLHMDGADNGTVFTDSSMNSHTITANGNTATKVGEKKFGTASAYFDGTGDHLVVSDGTNLSFGTGDFTIDFWVNLDSVTQGANETETILCSESWYQSGNGGWAINCDFRGGGNEITLYGTNGNPASGGSASLFTATSCGLQANTWHHIALVRSSGTVAIYVDGVSKNVGTWAFDMSQKLTHIGQKQPSWHYAGTTLDYLNGYLDEVRLSGVARYTEAFTPPTAPVTGDRKRSLDVHKRSLLTLNGEAFTETSGMGHTVTTAGNVALNTSVKKFGTSSYHFPDNSSAMTIPHHDIFNLIDITHEYTVEFWFNSTTPTGDYIWSKHSSGSYARWAMQLMANGNIRLLIANSNNSNYEILQETSGHASLADGNWHHCALTRADGKTRIWIDGVKRLENTSNYDIDITDDHDFTIGGYAGAGGYTGYLDEFSITEVCKYTEDFTPESKTGIEPGLYYRDPKGVLTKIS